MTKFVRLLLALGLPWLLTACLVTPGKFASTLDVRADHSFTFSYKGEVLAYNFADDLGRGGMGGTDAGLDDQAFEGDSLESDYFTIAYRKAYRGGQAAARFINAAYTPGLSLMAAAKVKPKVEGKPEGGDFDPYAPPVDKAKMEAIAASLSKEEGYKSVRYLGGNKFLIDYEISGHLDHGFIYPFNMDAQIVVPFVAVELRGGDKVRIKAPGFANSETKRQMVSGSAKEMEDALDGTFTLTTDANIVSQNEEDGAQPDARGKKLVWKVGALTREAPMAVLQFGAAGK